MRHVVIVLVTLILTGAYAGAQITPAPSAQAVSSDSEIPQAQAVQGKIKALDRAKKTLTLEDGTTLTFPEYVKVTPVALRKGAMIRATYEEQGGQKLVTSIEVQPPSRT
jgi:Protein of unknown function (DUF1344)